MTNSVEQQQQSLENHLPTDEFFKQKQALLKLLTSEDLAELNAKSDNKFNIFQALKLQNNEVKHSNFLGWLLTPFESHNLMDCFLKELLKIALQNDTSLVDIILSDLTDAKVTLEKMANDGRRMDIFIKSPRNKLVCVIENKVWSGEGCNQLEDYRDYILNHDNYKDYKHKIFLFLTPYKYSLCEDYKGYIRINYGDILKAINNLMKQYGCLLDDDVKIFIEHYKKMVERNIMGETDKEIIDLCRKIYRENKSAIDLIVQYGNPKTCVLSILEEVLNERNDIIDIKQEKNGFLFLPSNINNKNLFSTCDENDSVVHLNCWGYAWDFDGLFLEVLIGSGKDKFKINSNEKKSLIQHITTEMNKKVKDKICFIREDKDYTPSRELFNLLTHEEYLNCENVEVIKEKIKTNLENSGYIDALRDALNSWNPEK